MSLSRALRPRLHLRPWFAALLAGIVVHIAATLVAPRLVGETAFSSLRRSLPANTMRVLPPVTPAAQPLPFLAADARYAMCLYDLRDGPVTVSANLYEAGWSLAIYSADSESFYAVPGVDERVTQVLLTLVPPGDRFTRIAMGTRAASGPQVISPTGSGVIVIRGPDNGLAFARRLDADLGSATCAQLKS